MTNPAWMDAIEEVAEHTDMNEAVAGGGGDYVPPAVGLTWLRFTGYVEHGVHEEEYEGKVKKVEKVWMRFQLFGPNHPVREDGTPHEISFNVTKSQNEKSNFYKLFKRMNYDGAAKHMAQLLGKAFLGEVFPAKKAEDKRTYLRGPDGFSIRSPHVQDPMTGEMRTIPCPEPVGKILCFLWTANAKYLKGMWDDIHIDGKWDDQKDDAGNVIKEGRSKNYHQDRIKSATNFQGSPIAEVLFGQGAEVIQIEEAAKPERKEADVQAGVDLKAGASADPLANVA